MDTIQTAAKTENGAIPAKVNNVNPEASAGGVTADKSLESTLKHEELDMSAEELNGLKSDLLKSFDDFATKDEHNTIKILKILQKVKMSEALLNDTKIGKVLTSITVK